MTRSGKVWALSLLTLITPTSADTSEEWNKHIGFSNTSDIILHDDVFTVACNNCTITGDLSVSGGCDYDTCHHIPDTNFTGLPYDFTDLWLGAVIEDFTAVFDFNISLTPNASVNEISIPLLAPVFPKGIVLPVKSPFASVDFTFNPIVHGWVNASQPVNFSYGFQLEIPANASIWVPIVHGWNATSTGFNESTIRPLNYSSSDLSGDFTFELSFRPQFEISGSAVGADLIDVTAYADVPKLDIAVAQVSNVTYDCLPATSNTPTDDVFHNLTQVTTNLGFDFDFNVTIMSNSWDQLFGPWDNKTIASSCLYYSEKEKSLGPVPDKSAEKSAKESGAASVYRAWWMILLSAAASALLLS